MPLTDEEVNSLLEKLIEKFKPSIKSFVTKQLEDLDLPDTRNLVTKKLLNDTIETLRNGFNEEFKKRDEAITKIANETETKIKELTPPKSKPWWGTVLDYQD